MKQVKLRLDLQNRIRWDYDETKETVTCTCIMAKALCRTVDNYDLDTFVEDKTLLKKEYKAIKRIDGGIATIPRDLPIIMQIAKRYKMAVVLRNAA